MSQNRSNALSNAPPLVFLLPVYDDWATLPDLLEQIDRVAGEQGWDARVVVVDDGSSRPFESGMPDGPGTFSALTAVEILELRRNLGHQRAIAVGLAHVHERHPERTVAVLDGDGEDDPADVPRLMERYLAEDGEKAIFAARRKRSENLVFQLFYRFYQVLHWMLTGRGIRVGNFSLLPPRAVARLVVSSEAWSHYAAAVIVGRVPRAEVPTDRAQRLGGRTKMDFAHLVLHGFAALSVYSQVIGVRLLIAVALLTLGSGAVLGAYVAGPTVGGPWVAVLLALWVLLLLQAVAATVLFVFVLLAGRRHASVVPLRDYGLFVLRSAAAYP